MKIPSLVALLSLLVFANCNSYSVPSPIKPGSRPGGEPAPKQQAIVLFHGLGNPVWAVNDEISDLRQAFPNAKVVAFQSNEQQGIVAQAQKTYQELQAQDLHQADLVFMGISTGGVVAIETLNQHSALAVKGIIAYHSPLKGAPIAAAKKKAIDTLEQEVDTLVSKIKDFLPPELVSGVITNIKQIFQQYTQGQAAQDLKPRSPFMTTFKDTLSKVGVPILAIAGKGGSLVSLAKKLLGLDLSTYKGILGSLAPNLDLTLVRLVGAQDHDGLLPLASQQAQHINNPRIERYTPKDESHYGAIPPETMKKIKKNIESYFQP